MELVPQYLKHPPLGGLSVSPKLGVMAIDNAKRGNIEVVYGPMFSGKTAALIAELRRAESAGCSFAAFKPRVDDRQGPGVLLSHSGDMCAASSVVRASELVELVPGLDVAAIDEVQFFDTGLVSVVERISALGIRVVAAGLDLDFRAKPFLTTARLVDSADRKRHMTASCARCGRPATHTQRFTGGRPAAFDEPTVRIGADEMYEPRCFQCWSDERREPLEEMRGA